jgi:hypothetical protein
MKAAMQDEQQTYFHCDWKPAQHNRFREHTLQMFYESMKKAGVSDAKAEAF